MDKINDNIVPSPEKSLTPQSKHNMGPVFVIEDFDRAKRTNEQKKVIEKMDEINKLYRSDKKSTIDFKITKKAFDELQKRPGMKGDGYSRLVTIVENEDIEYHLIVAPYTNVSEIDRSDNPDRKELTVAANGLTFHDDPDIGFELAVITRNDVPLKDRSKLYLKDVLGMEFIPIETAQQLITSDSKK